MSKIFLAPDHLHTSDRVLSCTEEAGLCAGPATASGGNAGRLRLATAGGTSEAVTLDVALQTGGNPYGYRLANNYVGSGASLRWKNSTDGSTSWRGYVDTPYFVRAWIVRDSATAGTVGGMKQLPNGKLGVTVDRVSGSGGCVFWTFDRSYTREVNSIPATDSGAAFDSDFVVLPSGRLVAFFCGKNNAGTDDWSSFYSDDNGATWALLSDRCIDGGPASSQISVEAVDDLIVAVLSTGSVAAQVWTSRDGGCTFEQTGTGSNSPANVRTCTTKTGQVLAIQVGTVNTEVLPIIPGGGFGAAVQGNTGEYNEQHAIVTRDDGTVWVFSANTSVSNIANIMCSVSIDDGASFTEAGGAQNVLYLHDTPTANPLTGLRAASWRGRVVLFAVTAADTGTDDNVIALEFGEWASVTDYRKSITANGQPYEHTYLGAVDYPDALGWTRDDYGGGATISNTAGALRILCASTNSRYRDPPAGFWANAAGNGKRVRLRVKVAAGGDLTADHASLRFATSDGANKQEVKVRFTTTGFRVLDGPGNTIVSVTETMTSWTDILIAYLHDANPGVSAAVSVWHRQDADDEGLWTLDVANGVVVEDVGTTAFIYLGGTDATSTADWQIANLQIADDDNDLADVANAATANPGTLAGRPVPASVPMWVGRGMLASGFNGAGVPGDSYTLATTYQWGKASVWAEFRPSRQVRSVTDNAAWAVVFDAGSTSLFTVQHVMVFGTNNRQITVQMNATDSWGSPSVSQALTTVLAKGTVGSGNRGLGYVGPTVSPLWIPGRYKSDGRARRYFLSVGGQSYEISDNDESAIYVAGVDFSAASGTFYIFGDRGAVDLGTRHRYRHVRILYAAEQTADDHYRLGTVYAGRGYTPAMEYAQDFVDIVEPNVEITETEAGIEGATQLGATRESLQIQWTTINRMHPDHGRVGEELQAMYRAIVGSKTPLALWRDNSDIGTLGLYRVVGSFARPNVRGELATAAARVDVLTLREVV